MPPSRCLVGPSSAPAATCFAPLPPRAVRAARAAPTAAARPCQKRITELSLPAPKPQLQNPRRPGWRPKALRSNLRTRRIEIAHCGVAGCPEEGGARRGLSKPEGPSLCAPGVAPECQPQRSMANLAKVQGGRPVAPPHPGPGPGALGPPPRPPGPGPVPARPLTRPAGWFGPAHTGPAGRQAARRRPARAVEKEPSQVLPHLQQPCPGSAITAFLLQIYEGPPATCTERESALNNRNSGPDQPGRGP